MGKLIWMFTFALCAFLILLTPAKADHFEAGQPFQAAFFCESAKALKFYFSLPEDQLDPIPDYIDCWSLPFADWFVVVAHVDTFEARGNLFEIYSSHHMRDQGEDAPTYFSFNPIGKPDGA